MSLAWAADLTAQARLPAPARPRPQSSALPNGEAFAGNSKNYPNAQAAELGHLTGAVALLDDGLNLMSRDAVGAAHDALPEPWLTPASRASANQRRPTFDQPLRMMEHMETHQLFAHGLGLIFSSSGALRSLAEDESAVDQDAVDEAFDRLCREQRAFLLATGSPELDYDVQVHRQAWPLSVVASLREIVVASLFLEGEELVIRDGHDLEAWGQRPEAAILVRTTSACCRLKIGVAPSVHHGTMRLHILLEEGAEPLPGPEMIELFYKAP